MLASPVRGCPGEQTDEHCQDGSHDQQDALNWVSEREPPDVLPQRIAIGCGAASNEIDIDHWGMSGPQSTSLLATTILIG